jgi:hypothetical protein
MQTSSRHNLQAEAKVTVCSLLLPLPLLVALKYQLQGIKYARDTAVSSSSHRLTSVRHALTTSVRTQFKKQLTGSGCAKCYQQQQSQPYQCEACLDHICQLLAVALHCWVLAPQDLQDQRTLAAAAANGAATAGSR